MLLATERELQGWVNAHLNLGAGRGKIEVVEGRAQSRSRGRHIAQLWRLEEALQTTARTFSLLGCKTDATPLTQGLQVLGGLWIIGPPK